MKQHRKNALLWVGILIFLALIYDLFQNGLSGKIVNYPFSEFLSKVDQGEVLAVTVQGNNIRGKFNDDSQFITYSPHYPTLIDKLQSKDVKIEAVPNETKINSLLGIILSWFPILLLIGVWVFFMRQMQGAAGGKAMGFGKSKAELFSPKPGTPKVTFKDVAGIDEAKEELLEIVDFLKDPEKYSNLGAKIPKGCLLYGSPGTGKTLLARAVAGEANVNFFSTAGSHFVEMFVGVGASRVRDLFERALENAPSIIFIDEIDSIGKNRGVAFGGGNEEREQALNQLLIEMDGFKGNEGVIVIAATNRPDVLDPALLRPGRFDRQITVPTPDLKGREQILKIYLDKIKKLPNIDARTLARGTQGFSGADLANLVNEAAIFAARTNKKVVTIADFESAKDRIMMGEERKSMVMSNEEKTLTAYHEGGHALVSHYLPISDPIHKATIIPRGRALGVVIRLPESDKFSVTIEKLKADIAIAMGGRVAEAIIFGDNKITSGASSDIQQATKMAKAMVTQWGMSDKVGPIYHGNDNDPYSNPRFYAEDTGNVIDEEIRKIVEEGYNKAKDILTKYLDQLHLLAKTLLEKETLSGEQIKELLETGALKDQNIDSTKDSPPSSSLPKVNLIDSPIEDSDPQNA
jgi:cell division protease FtsH